MKTKLKMSTLEKIAREIQRERRITVGKVTVSEMWEMLDGAAGHCRTRAEAKAAIEKDVYNIIKED